MFEVPLCLVPLCFGITTALITFARRSKNLEPNAGIGVAGWGLVGTFILSLYSITGILSIHG